MAPSAPAARPTPEVVTSSFLLGNLHCPTCVSTIQEVIQDSCAGHVRWVSPNLVTSVVTVEHDPAASARSMYKALEESGFEVCGATTTAAGEGSDIFELSTIDERDDGGGSPVDGHSGDRSNDHSNKNSSNNHASSSSSNSTNHNVHDSPAQRPGGALSRWRAGPRFVSRAKPGHNAQLRAHLQNCEQCRRSLAAAGETVDAEKQTPSPSSETQLVSQPSNSAMSDATTIVSSFSAAAPDAPRKTATSRSFVVVESDDDDNGDAAGGAPTTWRATVAIGGMTCAACANTITEELNRRDWVASAAVHLVTNSATVELYDPARADELVGAIEDLGYDATLDSIVPTAQKKASGAPPRAARRRAAAAAGSGDVWRATLSVGGMTCASCANAITQDLAKRDWVSDVAVNLVANSAAVVFRGRPQDADRLVEAVRDLGYEAALDSVVEVAQDTTTEEHPEEDDSRRHARTVEIRIDGLYCEHCPARILNSLAGFRRPLEVLQPPTIQRPIVKVRYVPDAPAFTVRRLLAAVEASDPAFRAALYHPPTLEERSKQIQRRHQRQLLARAVFTGVVCVPTFVLGIVYMSLVPAGNPAKTYLDAPWTSGISRAQMALFVLATPVYFFAADVFHVRACKEIRHLWRRGSRTPLLQRFYRFGSMNTLMSLGTTIAYVSSVSQLIAAAAHRPRHVEDASFYFDSVVFLTFFLLLGRLIESLSKSKTGDAVEKLGKLRPTTAVLVGAPPPSSGTSGTAPADKERDAVVAVDMLDVGDVVRVPHGGSPPADGTIVAVGGGGGDETSFDESSLTGESRPVRKGAGDEVFAGTVNQGGPVVVRVTGAAGRSMLDQIVEAVREGQTKRAPMEQIADRLTTYFVPAVTLIAIVTWVVWMALGLAGALPAHFLDAASGGGGGGGWVAFALQFAIAVFVVACPCGLALAAPTALFVGGGLAARHGILAKGGGEAFEKASRVDCVVFDKTGTLTEGGAPSITDWELCAAAADATEDENEEEKKQQPSRLWAALRATEETSSHPVAKAIVAFCERQTAERLVAADVREMPGRGMQAAFRDVPGAGGGGSDGFELLVGNEALMHDFGVAIAAPVSETLERWKTEAKSVALAATRPLPPTSSSSSSSSSSSPEKGGDHSGWTLAAVLSVSDPIRPEAAAVIRALQARGTRVWMLSGDHPTTAAAVGRQLGIPAEQIIAGVLPTEKAAQVTYLQSTLKARAGRGRRHESTTRRAVVAMVGDGINDSPALATADVGVAIGSGSDVAISSAAFVLVGSDLRGVATLLDLSRAVFRRIQFNFGWAVVYNVLALPVAAGALYAVESGGKHVRLDPVWASLAMALSSISVVTSSLALRSGWPVVGFRATQVE